MRILFLDVDGVLNNRATFVPSRHNNKLDEAAITRLKHIVDATGCKVVLSSSWRLWEAGVQRLKALGGFVAPHEDWRTIHMNAPVINGIILPVKRGEEIAEWLSRHPEVERYAIVDDDDDMLPGQMDFFCPDILRNRAHR